MESPRRPFLDHSLRSAMRTLLTVLACFSFASNVGQTNEAGRVDYAQHVRPLLREKCGACHGAVRTESGLRLDTGALARRGGDSGAAIVPGAPSESELIRRVRSTDESLRMPPAGLGEPLDDEQIAILTAWISAGATSPEDEPVPAGPEDHWAYQPIVRPALPIGSERSDRSDLASNPIDAFVEANLRHQRIVPLPLAAPRTAVRRLYFDLLGLPPSTAEQQSLSVIDDDGWSRLVDQLLTHPAYGQRWGRHWMDIWRYSDWDGYKQEVRGSQRHIWRWRDWIVESLNADVGYDQMIVQMLAGDEVAPRDPNVLRATGFLARNFHNSNRNIWLDATVEHTAKAFLAMTVNCARCHDHKYDPIDQHHYYAFRAVFEPHDVRTERLPGVSDTVQDGLVRVFDAHVDRPTYLFLGGNEKHPDKENSIEPGVPMTWESDFEPTPVTLPDVAVLPTLRDDVWREDHQEAVLRWERAAMDAASETSPANQYLTFQRARAAQLAVHSLAARWRADLAKLRVELDQAAKHRDDQQPTTEAETAAAIESIANTQQAVADWLEAKSKRDQIEISSTSDKGVRDKAEAALKKAHEKLAQVATQRSKDQTYTPASPVYRGESTGRRTALARWIASPRNRLTARVAVNHLWLRHFGQPLVANVFDFGLRTPEPVQRELLDWLAAELIEQDWRLKAIHRMILTSRLYRRSSPGDDVVSARNQEQDPENRWWWSFPTQRLDAEVVRDSVLAVAGNLDMSFAGPDIDHSLGEINRRRSLYFRHAYEKQMTMMLIFDVAAPTECYRRSESITPQQALALSNSPLSLAQARLLAAKLSAAHVADHEFVDAAFATVLGRDARTEESTTCVEFLAEQAKRLAAMTDLTPFESTTECAVPASPEAAQRARENLVHVLMNHNDFVTVR